MLHRRSLSIGSIDTKPNTSSPRAADIHIHQEQQSENVRKKWWQKARIPNKSAAPETNSGLTQNSNKGGMNVTPKAIWKSAAKTAWKIGSSARRTVAGSPRTDNPPMGKFEDASNVDQLLVKSDRLADENISSDQQRHSEQTQQCSKVEKRKRKRRISQSERTPNDGAQFMTALDEAIQGLAPMRLHVVSDGKASFAVKMS